MMNGKTTFGALRQFMVSSLGCEVAQGPRYVRFKHPPTASEVTLRPYIDEEIVRDIDVATIRTTFVARGAVEEKSFDQFLQTASAKVDLELDFLFDLFWTVCELGEALRGQKLLRNRFRMEAIELPYNAEFHRLGALDDLMRKLNLTADISEWKATELAADRSSPRAKEILGKIGEAIHPLIFLPVRSQTKDVEDKSFAQLGEAATDLDRELELRSHSANNLRDDMQRVWPAPELTTRTSA